MTRILVVDDEQDVREVVKTTLQENGYQVVEAADGIEGYAAAADAALAEKPDLIILDIMMPGLDGYEVLSRLRKDPETLAIPVVVLTAYAGLEEVSKAISLGAVEVISKPCKPEEIVNAIRANLPTASR